MELNVGKPSAQDLLAEWRAAERMGKTARSAAEAAGLAVESADAAKAAASSAQAAAVYLMSGET